MATVVSLPRAEEIETMLVTILAGAAGGSPEKWRTLMGSLEPLPTWRFVRFNWRVEPSGTAMEREVIAKAVEIVRAEHPYISQS